MTDRDRTLIEELEERLRWYREEATEEEFDAEEVDAICTMLEKLDPVEPRKSKEEAFEDLMRQIRKEEESGEQEAEKGKRRERHPFTRRKKALRAAVIAIAVVGAILSLDRVTYARENKSLFTMILEKVGWIEVEKEKGVEGTVLDNGTMSGEFYNSWAELDAEIKERLVIPEYVPEGYSLFGIRSWKYSDKEVLQANYYDQENGHILFEIILWKDNADHQKELLSNEDMYTLIPEYSDKKTYYFEYEDEYVCMAFMENSFYRIYGNVSLEELIKMREGLGQTR